MLLDLANAVFLAPLVFATISSVAVLNIDLEPPLSELDTQDPAQWWQTSYEWLGAPEEEIPVNQYSSIGLHRGGRWRTLRRFNSVQSVTRWDPIENQPLPKIVGNEYIKVMASAHAALSSTTDDESQHHLYLGLGAGTLPMLMDSNFATAIELDSDVVHMATEYCGLNINQLKVIVGDALDHCKLTEDQQRHSAIFVDIFGADNNVPKVFCENEFVESMYDALQENGVLIANFHRGSGAENERLREGQETYARVFGQCLSITSRFQGNVILAAVKNYAPKLDIDRAQRVAREKQWPFDPALRLQKVKTIKR